MRFLDQQEHFTLLYCKTPLVCCSKERKLLITEEAFATSRIVEKLNGTHRRHTHGRVNSNSPDALAALGEVAAKYLQTLRAGQGGLEHGLDLV